MEKKNQGCIIAGCAGAAILAVLLAVGGGSIAYYFYQKSQSERIRQVYEQRQEPPPPLPPANTPSAPVAPASDDQPISPTPAQPVSYSSPLIKESYLPIEKQKELVARTLEGFQQAINLGTFRGFAQFFVANQVKNQLTAQVFDKNFAKFIAMKINVDPASFRRQGKPKFTTQKELNAQKTLIELAGDYLARNPHGALVVKWEFTYLYEEGRGWGVTGIQLNVVPAR